MIDKERLSLCTRNSQEHDKYLNRATDSGQQTCQKIVYSAEGNIERNYYDDGDVCLVKKINFSLIYQRYIEIFIIYT